MTRRPRPRWARDSRTGLAWLARGRLLRERGDPRRQDVADFRLLPAALEQAGEDLLDVIGVADRGVQRATKPPVACAVIDEFEIGGKRTGVLAGGRLREHLSDSLVGWSAGVEEAAGVLRAPRPSCVQRGSGSRAHPLLATLGLDLNQRAVQANG